MIEQLEPLTRHAGVRLAALVTDDGVPIAFCRPGDGESFDGEGGPAGTEVSAELEALAAGAVGLVGELASATGALSWRTPERICLRAVRGTLLMLRTSNAVLVVVLEAGMDPEGLRLPMDGIAARIQRVLRGMGEQSSAPTPNEPSNPPPSPLPSRSAGVAADAFGEEAGAVSRAENSEPNPDSTRR